MFLRICRNIDKVSMQFSDPVVLTSILLAKDRKFLQNISISGIEEISRIINEVSRSASTNSIIHYRLNIMNNIYRVFTLKDIAIAVIQEDEIGQVVRYGSDLLQELSKVLESKIRIDMIIEEVPTTNIDPGVASLVKTCSEEVEKIHIAMWRKRGLYWFAIDELISDKGSYTYVFKARDASNDTYVLKVFKEDIAVNRNFMDLVRGYVQGFIINTLDEKEFEELIELKGYDRSILRELFIYREFISPVKALLILRTKLDRDSYLTYPPVIVEEYASLGDLESYVQKNGIRSLEEAMYIVIRVAGAIALAHLMNIVHLDVKPRNILLYQDIQEKSGYIPKINDFSGAVGDPTRGYRFTRITPGYADPLALARGVSDFSYDVYSIAMVLAYILSGNIPKHRLILNIALLQNMYGYPIPMEKIEDDEKMLRDFLRKTIDILAQLRSKVISYQEFVQKIEEDLDALDVMYMPWLNDVPKTIAEITKRALILKNESRYKSCIEMWLDLKDALTREKMEKILPK